jgi:hypothetical protein
MDISSLSLPGERGRVPPWANLLEVSRIDRTSFLRTRPTGRMQFSRVQFSLWRLMAVVAGVACFAAALVAFSEEHASGERILFAWLSLYGAPLILIVARRVSLGRLPR